MNPISRYDVIIIGSGAGGATLAWRLAATQKSVLVLERGDYLPHEAENRNSDAVFVRNRYKARDEWLNRRGRKFKPATHYCVGGNTKVYGAALFRLRERDFLEIRHKDGISPAWPISYAELAPYYLAAERLYQVHGLRGSDPTEPPCDADYDYPAVAHEPAIQQAIRQPKTQWQPAFSAAACATARRSTARDEPVHQVRDLRRFSMPAPRQGRCGGDLHAPGARERQCHVIDQPVC